MPSVNNRRECTTEREWAEIGVLEPCPVLAVREYEVLFRARNWAEKGFFPNSGGWADQPYYLIWAIEVINNAVADTAKEVP